jgi:hypothetical protein
MLDLALNGIADLGDRLFLCSEFPTNYTEASATFMLATVNLTVGDGNGDFVVGEGETSGRRLSILTQLAGTVTNTGSATHIAICDSVGTDVLLVQTCQTNPIEAAQSIDIDDFTYTIGDPA